MAKKLKIKYKYVDKLKTKNLFKQFFIKMVKKNYENKKFYKYLIEYILKE